MKRSSSVIIFFALLFVFSKWGPAINFNTTTQQKGEPFVVTGEGKVSVTPDIAKISVGIGQTGQSLKQVQNDVNTKSKKLTDAIKKLGIAESDIKTSSYNVYPQYDYTNPGQKIVGYQVSTDYEITIKDFDKINDVVVASTASGANTVGNADFVINDATKKVKLQEARDLAVKSAKEKAEGLAKAANISLGKIINISENQNGGVPRAFGVPVSGGGNLDKSIAQPDIQPGQTDIAVTVSLSFEIR